MKSARETLDDWTEEARDKAEEVMERGSEIADELRDRVKPIAQGHAPQLKGLEISTAGSLLQR